ncbi:Flagella basal body rod protein [Oryzisolibacter propanilivorax]|uniref:Flagella basal body rod protein n=1 Tax=Oryzisolibacter propanilivorax TaxID=1527607 RepID=A0A1G9QPI1_9BURK|nr:flagellar basal body protein [Oryzisolibacter propanilivorax]SDM12906.1 Flagella basal body rod protein [Oryzisolibacter propanilivorax]
MSSITSTAASGLNAAQLRLSGSAHNIANANTPGFTRQETRLKAAPDQGGVQAQAAPASAPGVALEAETVEQIAAAHAFKAHALVLRSADAALGTLLDVRA